MSALLAFCFLRQMAIQIVEPTFPELSERLDPVSDILHRARAQPSWSSLCIATALDEARVFENLEVLRDGRLAEPKRLIELVDTRFSLGEPSDDCAPRGIAQCEEDVVQHV